MHKLVILIEPLEDMGAFQERWPEFIRLVASMPELRREVDSSADHFLYGQTTYAKMHELYFDSLQDAQRALSSPNGRQAGALLQQITGGRMVLFLADHREDEAVNFRPSGGSEA